ncbi:MAG: TolB family protein [Myxococcales bacterium]|jgi:hypothetical protein
MHEMALALLGVLLAGGPNHEPATAPAAAVEAVQRVTFDERDGRVLEGVVRAFADSSPPRTAFTLLERSPSGSRKLAEGVGAAAYAPDGAILYVQGESLIELDLEGPRVVAEKVAPDFALDPSGETLAVVRLGEPGGGTAIDLLSRKSGEAKRLVGPDGLNGTPVFSPDGDRIAFSSTRTGVASVFVVRRDGAGLRQVTNKGIKAGRGVLGPDFIPPIESRRGLRFVDGSVLEYRGADGLWRVNLESGRARPAEGGSR